MELLPAIEHSTDPKPDTAIIWLHGLGADGNDFAPIVPQLQLPENLKIRFIFPHAPEIPVTVNGGMVMPAWYDILEMDIDRKVDTHQLMNSSEAIAQHIEYQIDQGIDSSRIILAGFSQGGAVAYQVGLSSTRRLGGLLAMSTYLATSESIVLSKENSSIPIEIQHGSFDPVVPEQLGQKAHGFLTKNGYSPGYKSYPMEHNVCPQQIEDIALWLSTILL